MDNLIPSDQQPSNHKEEASHHSEKNKPEFIIIDDTRDYVYGSDRYSQFDFEEEELQKIQKNKHPLVIRAFCLLGVFGCLIFAGSILSGMALALLLAALCLFQNKRFNLVFFNLWKLFKNASVIAFGLTVALFSPTLGIALLILYFSLKGEKTDKEWIKGMLKRFFS